MPIVERYINGNVGFWEVEELRLCGTCKHFSPEEPGGFDECSRVTTMKFFTLVTGEEYTEVVHALIVVLMSGHLPLL